MIETRWCETCGGLIVFGGPDAAPIHACIPETADGFSLAGQFYRYDRDAHIWLQRRKDNGIWSWIPADLPGDVLLEVAHMRNELILP